MFNKNIFLAAGLMFSTVTTVLPVGEQEREIIYTIHELGQDFAQIPMVVQNIDAFIGIFQMNIEMTEAKLAVAAQKARKSLVNNIAATIVTGFGMAGVATAAYAMMKNMGDKAGSVVAYGVNALLYFPGVSLLTTANIYCALNIRNAYKAKNALAETLELDKEILEKLIEIKELLAEGPVEAEIVE